MRLALPGRLPFGLRFVFRGAFALLVAATLALALAVLGDEKQRRHAAYADSLRQSQAQLVARLRHPAGQLLLLNPGAAQRPATPVVPLALPFGAIDFDDRAKAQQAVELAGCAVQYPDGTSLCAGIGSRSDAGAFVYLVAGLAAGPLVPHRSGNLDLSAAHRALVELRDGPRRLGWVAPFERLPGDAAAVAADTTDAAAPAPGPQRGRLTGFADDTAPTPASRPQRDFRAWLWQEPRCLDGGDSAGCVRRTWVSMRLPAAALREADAGATAPLKPWPPADPSVLRLRLRLLPPGSDVPLFDSDTPGATLPFALDELRRVLMPGETLTVRREGRPAPLVQLRGDDGAGTGPPDSAAPWLERLVRRLPAATLDETRPLELRETFAAAQGRFELVLAGDLRATNRQLAAGATRVWGFVAALLALVLATWLALEMVVMRRITLLTRRAAALSSGVREGGELQLDVADLHGRDELGVLAQGLRDLLARVNDDVRRARIRARQEQDQWHAVGHEIMSPLQSLLALHGGPDDPSRRYIDRMQQAVRVLYGQASPSEAFAAHALVPAVLDLQAFLSQVAANAPYIGIDDVRFEGALAPLLVRADEYALEDAIGHLLRNAQRHRLPGTPIRLRMDSPDPATARVAVHNHGPAIDETQLERIFEYGVSGAAPQDDGGAHRGQGLFVARTYLAKMGGTLVARNDDGGVCFELTLPRAT